MRILLILICLLLAGCSNTLGDTKTTVTRLKDSILTADEYLNEKGETEVRYKYVSDVEVKEDELKGKKEDLSLRTAFSKTFTNGNEYTIIIYPTDQFEKVGEKWYQIETATTTKAQFDSINKVSFFNLINVAQAVTFYSSTSDAFIYNGGSGECAFGQPWSGCHDATSGDLTTTVADFNVGAGRVAISDAWFFQRVFIPFDTSAIPSDVIVMSASLNLKPTVINGDTGTTTDFIRVVQTSQAANTVVNADFDQCGSIDNPTAGASDVDMNSLATSTYYSFTLNSTGLGWIKKNGETSNCGTTAGWTCLGLREGHDALDYEVPTLKRYSTGFASADTAGTASDPYLEISYVKPGGEIIKFE
jgi:hypothetical protein